MTESARSYVTKNDDDKVIQRRKIMGNESASLLRTQMCHANNLHFI